MLSHIGKGMNVGVQCGHPTSKTWMSGVQCDAQSQKHVCLDLVLIRFVLLLYNVYYTKSLKTWMFWVRMLSPKVKDMNAWGQCYHPKSKTGILWVSAINKSQDMNVLGLVLHPKSKARIPKFQCLQWYVWNRNLKDIYIWHVLNLLRSNNYNLVFTYILFWVTSGCIRHLYLFVDLIWD